MKYPLLKNNLPQSIKNVWRKTNLFSFLIMLIMGIIVAGLLIYFDNFEGSWVLISIVYFSITIAILLFSFALIPLRYNYFRYEITDDDIIFQKGYIFRAITYVPINRIQHIETEQGPFLRQDNLMELLIHTAATTHKIAGLSVDDTLKLRAQIIEKMKEVEHDI